jgi:integrase
LPAEPETVGAYLAAAGPGYALPTLRRRVAAIAREHRMAKQPLDTRHPAIRETLRGIEGNLLESITPHGMRAGFITTAYRNGVPDEEIMGHTPHRSLPTMRTYIRRGKLAKKSPAGMLGL